MKRGMFFKIVCVLIAVLLVASVGAAAVSSISANAATAGQYGYINGTYVNLRTGPGTDYSVITTMDINTKIQFTDGELYNDNWYKITVVSTSQSGYVYSDYVTEYTQTTTTTAEATATAAATTAAPTANEASAVSAASSVEIYGDINGDGDINVDDATLLQKHIVQLTTLSDKTVAMSDFTEDGDIGIDDVTVLQKYIAGIETGTNIGQTATEETTVEPTTTQPATTEPVTTQPVTTQPVTTQPTSSLRILNSSQTIYIGNQYVIYAVGEAATVSWSSSNTSVATIDSNGVVTAKGAGSVTITASDGYKKATVSLTVKSGTTVNINLTSASISAGKTIYLKSSTSGVKWKTSYYARATVSNGFATAASKGYATITAYTSTGAATCLLKISDKDDIRYTYSSPNSAPLNSTVTFYAITDTDRTAVRFVVSKGSEKYTVEADTVVKDGSTLVWSGSKKLTSAGEWSVRAYSKKSGSSSYSSSGSSENCTSTAFVTTCTNTITNVCTERRASSEIIQLIADYEGYISSITDDAITGDPNIGYGNLITSGEIFYNNITKNEAYAAMVAETNEGGYTSKLNSFLLSNSIKSNQRQFDALICFLYNLGANTINNDSDIKSALLNTGSSSPTAGGSGYVNATYVNLRSGPSTDYSIKTTMDINTKFTFVSATLYNSHWYNIKLSDGTTGYIYSDYATASGGTRTLDNLSKSTYINVFFCYHHASGSCYWGLLYRRVDEAEVFYYGDYTRDGQNNKKGFSYSCSKGGVYL